MKKFVLVLLAIALVLGLTLTLASCVKKERSGGLLSKARAMKEAAESGDVGALTEATGELLSGGVGIGISSGSVKGKFTLTGIPAKHNGKYAILYTKDDKGQDIWGSKKLRVIAFPFPGFEATAVKISNGKVTIPLFLYTDEAIGSGIPRIPGYSGNSTFNSVNFVIVEKEKLSLASVIFAGVNFAIETIQFDNVKVSKGNASTSWNKGTVQE